MSDKSPISLRGRRLKLKEKNLGALYYIGSFWLRKEKKYWDVVVIMKYTTFFCFLFCIIRGYVLSCFTESANLVACEKAPGSSFRRESHLLIPLKRGCSFRFELYLVFYILPRPIDRIPKVANWEEEKKPAKSHLAENGDARAWGAETQAKDQVRVEWWRLIAVLCPSRDEEAEFTVVTERQQLATLDGLECL